MSKGVPGRCFPLFGNLWKSLEIFGNLWKSLEILGNPWKSLEILGNPWKSPWKSLEIVGAETGPLLTGPLYIIFDLYFSECELFDP